MNSNAVIPMNSNAVSPMNSNAVNPMNWNAVTPMNLNAVNPMNLNVNPMGVLYQNMVARFGQPFNGGTGFGGMGNFPNICVVHGTNRNDCAHLHLF